MSSSLGKADFRTEISFSGSRAIGWQVSLHSYAWSPPTDVFETENNFVVRVEAAGMSESDFTINAEDNFLVISGVRSEPPEWRSYRQMEIRFGEFSTAIELPLGVDVSKADADYKDGFLNVILPKLKPTNIIIKG
ncbi:MAG: Hsp20/alpha crystallin family protein [Anaerolineales bacterium]|jgi:HSP20 family protein